MLSNKILQLLFGTVLAATTALATTTKDTDQTHGHSPQYFKDIKTKYNANETLYVHLIQHTHDDVGWIKTVDQYFTGSN